MTFDDLAASWKQDLPADDHRQPADLKEAAITTASQAEWEATVFELMITAIFGLTGAITLGDAILDGEPWHSYPPALITLGIAAFVYLSRVRRRQQMDLSGSLTEMIDSSLRSVEGQIARVKGFFWWFVLPTIVAVGINLAYNFQGRPWWVWSLQPLGIIAFWVAMMMQMRSSHLPHRAALKSLQEQLASEPS